MLKRKKHFVTSIETAEGCLNYKLTKNVLWSFTGNLKIEVKNKENVSYFATQRHKYEYRQVKIPSSQIKSH